MKRTIWACAALVVPLLAPAARADSFTPAQRAEIVRIVRDALRDDPSILRDALGTLQDQEVARQRAAQSGQIAANRAALLANATDPVAGDPHGTTTLVEFYDPRCPYCRAMLPVLAKLIEQNPHLRLVYKDMPVLGPTSVLESRALLAAQRQNGYARLQSVLMRAGATFPDVDSIAAAAQSAGLDPAKLKQDMQDPAIQAHLDANLALAQKLQVEGTPAMVIGDQMFSGATDLPELQRAITAAR